MRGRRDSGETLVEILFTIVIMGLTVTALVSSLATTGNAGNAHRVSVQADVVLRNYAEAAKAAATQCASGQSLTVVYPTSLPSGFNAPTGASGACPPVGTTKTLTLTVIPPLGPVQTMDIEVRSP